MEHQEFKGEDVKEYQKSEIKEIRQSPFQKSVVCIHYQEGEGGQPCIKSEKIEQDLTVSCPNEGRGEQTYRRMVESRTLFVEETKVTKAGSEAPSLRRIESVRKGRTI